MKRLCFLLFILIHLVEGVDFCPWGCGKNFTDERVTAIGYLFWDCVDRTKFLEFPGCEIKQRDEFGDDITEIGFYKFPGTLIEWDVCEYFPSGNVSFICPFAKENYKAFSFRREVYSKKIRTPCPYHADPLNFLPCPHPWEACSHCRKNVQATNWVDDQIFASEYLGMIKLFSVLENDINFVFNITLRFLKLELIANKGLLETKTLSLGYRQDEQSPQLLLEEIQELREKIIKLSEELEKTQEQLVFKLGVVEETKNQVDQIYADIYKSCEEKHGLLHSMYYEAMRKFQNGSIEEALENILQLITKAKEMGMETSIDKEVYLQKGIIESELGQYLQAIDTLTRHLDKVLYDREAYFERAVAYFETGQFDQAFEDFIKSHEESTPVHPWTPLTFEYASGLTEGILAGSAFGVENFIPSTLSSATSLCHGIWALIKNPQKASLELVNATQACVQFVKAHSSSEIAQILVPELKELVNDWDILPDSKRGHLTGYIIGKYGIDIFVVGSSSKFFNAYRNLKKANNILAFELAALNKENKTLLLAEASRNLELKKGNIKHFDIKKVLNKERTQVHIFNSEHNLEKLGDRFTVIQKVTQEVFKADKIGLIPQAGPFEISAIIDGHYTVIRGAVVEGELKYSTIFIPK